MEPSQSTPPLPKYLQPVDETELTPQCRDLMSSLPSEPSCLKGLLHQYQGYWLSTSHLDSLLYYGDRNLFEARDSDIFLITFPKSGTTWLKAILFALANRTRYHPASPNHPLLSKNPHDLLAFMEAMISPRYKNKTSDLVSSTHPRIFSTHFPYALLPESVKETNCKVIYLCRNPKDVFVSTWHFLNKLRKNWCSPLMLDEALDKFCRSAFLFGGPYWDNVLGHWKESLANPGKVMFLKYEDLNQCPPVVVRKVAEFIGCPFSTDEESKFVVDDIIKLCSFEKLSSLEVNGPTKTICVADLKSSSFFRRGKVGDWANCLTPEMGARIDHITEEKFQGSGLSF